MTPLLAEAIERLKAIHDLIPESEADGNVDLASIRIAARMGLDAVSGTSTPRTVLASWGEPDRRTQKWMLHFEDTEMGTMVFDAALYGEDQAELLARDAYRRAKVAWNCTLFRVAADDPLDDERQRRRADALEATLQARGQAGDDGMRRDGIPA
jgi:hypothetical protein